MIISTDNNLEHITNWPNGNEQVKNASSTQNILYNRLYSSRFSCLIYGVSVNLPWPAHAVKFVSMLCDSFEIIACLPLPLYESFYAFQTKNSQVCVRGPSWLHAVQQVTLKTSFILFESFYTLDHRPVETVRNSSSKYQYYFVIDKGKENEVVNIYFLINKMTNK